MRTLKCKQTIKKNVFPRPRFFLRVALFCENAEQASKVRERDGRAVFDFLTFAYNVLGFVVLLLLKLLYAHKSSAETKHME